LRPGFALLRTFAEMGRWPILRFFMPFTRPTVTAPNRPFRIAVAEDMCRYWCEHIDWSRRHSSWVSIVIGRVITIDALLD